MSLDESSYTIPVLLAMIIPVLELLVKIYAQPFKAKHWFLNSSLSLLTCSRSHFLKIIYILQCPYFCCLVLDSLSPRLLRISIICFLLIDQQMIVA